MLGGEDSGVLHHNSLNPLNYLISVSYILKHKLEIVKQELIVDSRMQHDIFCPYKLDKPSPSRPVETSSANTLKNCPTPNITGQVVMLFIDLQ